MYRRKFSGVVAVLLWLLTPPAAASLRELPGAQLVGSGDLTWMGLNVYQASLHAPEGRYQPHTPHALKLRYDRSFSRERMAQRSLQEIEQIFGKQQQPDEIVRKLASVFSDVAKGDHITGVHYPGEGAEFSGRQGLLGRLDDAELAAAFFAIWLSPKTSEPQLRSQMLGNGR